jgi:nucleoside-triphosphatase THEP1
MSLQGKTVIPTNILVTGPPRSGKSTLIEKAINQIQAPITGFFTREIRQSGKRVGFSIATLDGKIGVLAHRKIKSRCRVGPYGINLQDLDQIAVPSMLPSDPEDLVIVDEIGKMECFSLPFKRALMYVLNSDHQLIGSIAIKGDNFIQNIKKRSDVLIIPISKSDRDSALELLLEKIRR